MACATVGVSRRRKAGRPSIEVGADERADVVDALLVRAVAALAGHGERGGGQVGTADRLAGGPSRVELAFVELEAELAQRGGHAQRAPLAVAEELAERARELGIGVVDAVAEDVQFAPDLGARRSTAEISTAGTTRTP